MQIPYPKPKKFSDPFYDWMGCEEQLDNILAKDKVELCLSDYNAIFAQNLPAASYEEGAYYLDSCFDLMKRKGDPVNSDICESLFWFIDFHRDALRQDSLLEPCLDEIVALFQSYTSTFELMRLTNSELTLYRINPDYREKPRYSRLVGRLLKCLVEYEIYSGILSGLLVWLNEDVIDKSCWWVELAYHVRWWYVIYNADDEANPRKQQLVNRLLDLHDYSFHWDKHRDHVRMLGYNQYERRVSLT